MAFCLPLAPQAQTEPGSDGKEPQYHLRFRVLSWDAPVTDLFFFQDGEKVPLLASRSHPSAWIDYHGPAPLVFYRPGQAVGDTPSSEPPPPVPAARFHPTESGEWLFIFQRDADTAEKYALRAIPEPDDKRREGLRFFNLSRREIALQVNDRTARIDSGEKYSTDPEPRPDNSLVMRVAARQASDWKMVFSTVLEAKTNRRTTLFIFDSGDEIRFRRFSEALPPPASPNPDG